MFMLSKWIKMWNMSLIVDRKLSEWNCVPYKACSKLLDVTKMFIFWPLSWRVLIIWSNFCMQIWTQILILFFFTSCVFRAMTTAITLCSRSSRTTSSTMQSIWMHKTDQKSAMCSFTSPLFKTTIKKKVWWCNSSLCWLSVQLCMCVCFHYEIAIRLLLSKITLPNWVTDVRRAGLEILSSRKEHHVHFEN